MNQEGCQQMEQNIGVHYEVALILLSRGANPNGLPRSTSNPLHRAVAAGAGGGKLVQLLCSHGAWNTARDKAGRTPAELARELGLEPLPELL